MKDDLKSLDKQSSSAASSDTSPSSNSQTTSVKNRAAFSNSQDASSSSSSSSVPSQEAQLEFAQQHLGNQLRLGDKWYLINADWYNQWSGYIGLESGVKTAQQPDKINNTKLLNYDKNANTYSLKDSLLEQQDYFTIPQELWNYLVTIYSINSNEDIIEREVINDAIDEYDTSSYKIELRKLRVRMECTWTNQQQQHQSQQQSQQQETNEASSIRVEEMSRQTKLDEIIQKMRFFFNIPNEKQVRVYYRQMDETMMSPVDLRDNVTLITSGFGVNDTIVVSVQDENGRWSVEEPKQAAAAADSIMSEVASSPAAATVPSSSQPIAPPPPAPALNSTPPTVSTLPPPYASTRYSQGSSRNYDSFSSSSRANDYKPGLCGLSNLGNTCFMNSSLQCMSNVPLLTDYFKQGTYQGEINRDNPLGRQGEVAMAYANLINEMWSGANSYTIPRSFKLNISKFAPQFTGYQQQDSQELLAFLLDGLHEDLNRIKKKPYVELGSHVGKTDEVFAEESWQDHKKRNDSIIVAIFHGLLKSTLNCLECDEISIKFDPFCYLSVPLPSKKERLVELFFVPLEQSQPIMKCKVSVLKNGTMQDLCGSLEALLDKDPSIVNKVNKNRMVVCDVYSNKFFKIYESSESVTSIRERDDIYIYELAANYNNSEYLKVKLHLREKSQYMSSSSCFGLPLFFMVQKENLTYGSMYQQCLKYLKRFLKNSSNSNEENSINSKLNNSLNVNDEDIENRQPSSGFNNDADLDSQMSNNNINNNNSSETENNAEDQDDQDDLVSDNSSSSATPNTLTSVRSSDRLKNKANQRNKLFNILLSKSDNIDFDNFNNVGTGSQVGGSIINDETPFEWQTSALGGSGGSNSRDYSNSYYNSSGSQSTSSNPIVSLIADFTSNSVKKFYKKKVIEDVAEHQSCSSQLVKRKDVIGLSDCFTLYTKMEELSEQDYWYCSKCKSHKPSTKKFDLWKLPQVLVVHLKRFSYSRLYRDKIDTLVDFPLTDLDMAPYLISKTNQETKYNLIAVSNHYGSLGGGHYTAYGQNRNDARWYYFDDSSVTSSDESNVCTPAAYMLIYLRKDLHQTNVGPVTRTLHLSSQSVSGGSSQNDNETNEANALNNNNNAATAEHQNMDY